MGKGDRRKGKPLPKGVPPLAPVQGRSHAKDRRGTNGPREDARVTALNARAMLRGRTTLAVATRFSGIGPPMPHEVSGPDERSMVTAPWLGCDLGRVMDAEVGNPDERVRLWGVWQSWCIAERRYRLRYLGATESARGAAFVMLPEVVETAEHHTVDVRTGEERDRDAVAAWMRWQGWIGMLPLTDDRTRLHQARREDGPALWRDREATDAGRATLRALMVLSDVVEGDRRRRDV